MSEMAEVDGSIIEFATEEIREDKDIIMSAVKTCPSAL